MTKVLLITSGSGGVGKTTVAINLASALRDFGRHVILMDLNVYSADSSLHLGAFKVDYALQDAIKNRNKIHEAVYMHSSGLLVMPSKISFNEEIELHEIKKIINWLLGKTELIIIDAPVIFDRTTLKIAENCDEAILVTTPDEISVVKTLKAIKILEEKKVPVLGVIVNKFKESEFELKKEEIKNFLGKPVLEFIREEKSLLESLKLKNPVVYSHPESDATQSFKYVASKLIGENYVKKIEEKEKESLYYYILKQLGLRK
jgi:MinD-like ATPase involved in chromosome partitioning or flagellar assembly